MNIIGLLSEVWMWCEIWLVQMGAEYKVHTQLLTEFETLGVMGENCSGIIKESTTDHIDVKTFTPPSHPLLFQRCRK